MTKLAFNYELKKVGRLFKIYEVKTKTYVAQGRNRKLVASICSRMNRGGFFDGETPGFFNLKLNILNLVIYKYQQSTVDFS